MAEISSDTPSEIEPKMKFIHQLYASLLRSATTKSSRDDSKQLKDRLEDVGIDYNEVAKWSAELRKILDGLKGKIDSLKIKNKKLQEDLRAKNETLAASNVELEVQRAKNVTLEAKLMNCLEEIRTNMKKLHEDLETKNETLAATKVELEANMKKLNENLEAKNETLAATKVALEVQQAKLAELEAATKVQEKLATNAGIPKEINAPNPGVKLFVRFFENEVSPVVSRPEVQSWGQYSGKEYFIKCKIGDLCPGWATFEAVRSAVGSLFTCRDIRRIHTWRGSVDDKTVTWVASLTDGDKPEYKYFCSFDGRESKREEVKTERLWIKEGGRIFIAGGQRRTILLISMSLS